MGIFRVSTDGVPLSERREYVEEHYAAMVRMSLDFDDAHPVTVSMSMRSLPRARLAMKSISPFRLTGHAQHDGALGDAVYFGLTLSDVLSFSQNGQEASSPPIAVGFAHSTTIAPLP